MTVAIRDLTSDVGIASQLTVMYKEFNLAVTDLSEVMACCNIAELTVETRLVVLLKEVMRYEGFNPREMMAML